MLTTSDVDALQGALAIHNQKIEKHCAVMERLMDKLDEVIEAIYWSKGGQPPARRDGRST